MSFPYAPQVVAKLVLIGQTNAISPTTVFTTTEEGDYQISTYLTISSATAGTIYTKLTYTDEYGENSPGIGANGGFGSNGMGAQNIIVHIVSGSTIQLSTTYTGGDGPYDIFVTVTQL